MADERRQQEKAGQARGEEARTRILDAALEAFQTVGFEGASLRAISTQAGVAHTLLLYHFKTKDALWRAVMERLLRKARAYIAKNYRAQASAPPHEAARALVRAFVHFFAAHPELHRIITFEGRQDGERMKWLVDSYTQPSFQWVRQELQALGERGVPVPEDSVRTFYALIGLTALPFTVAPEFKRLSGREPFEPEEMEACVDFVTRLLFPPSPPPPPRKKR